MSKVPVWVCYGGGTDSTAMIIEMVRRNERIDLVTFADTGDELPKTYKTVDIMDMWLRGRGYPGVTKVYPVNGKGNRIVLSEEVLKLSTLPSLAFGWHTCSQRFKIKPQVEYAKKFPVFVEAWEKKQKVIRCIGYDYGKRDGKRAKKSTTKFPDSNLFKNRFPLRQWRWSRERCLKEILKVGLEDPGKSSCYHCPARKRWEVDELEECNQDHLMKALKMEAMAIKSGKLKSTKGLGRSWSWIEYLKKKGSK